MVQLAGTPKQVAWAEKIRAELVKIIETKIETQESFGLPSEEYIVMKEKIGDIANSVFFIHRANYPNLIWKDLFAELRKDLGIKK